MEHGLPIKHVKQPEPEGYHGTEGLFQIRAFTARFLNHLLKL